MAVAYEQRSDLQEPTALERLFWAHYERILRAAYRVTGNIADAEDVTQSVFVRLASSGATEIDNIESYLYRAAINGALDLLRRRKSERQVDLEVAIETVVDGPASCPDHQLSNKETAALVRKAITTLSPRSAEMFVLRYIEERDNREIARLLGTSQAVVAVMLHQARAKMKKQFSAMMRGER